MKKLYTFIIVILVMLVFMPGLSTGQSTANYAYGTVSNGSLTNMTGSTDLLATGTLRTNVASTVATIPFTFYYMSIPYTQFSINSNGQMRLGATVIPGAAQTPAASIALLVPLSGSNTIEASGKVSYIVSGTAPNRILTVEWLNFRIPNSSTAILTNLSQMQVRLYETTGVIEYVYGNMYNYTASTTKSISHSSSNVVGTAPTPSTVGWIGSIITTPTYNTTTVLTPTTLTSVGAIPNLSSAADGSRRVFSFTPPSGPVSAAPTWAATPITNATTAGMVLNWNDLATNESGYQIQRSTDNITFTTIASLAADITSFTATGLTPSTLYYWKVAAYREAAEPLYTTSESMSTTATSTFTSIATGNWSMGSTWSTGVVPSSTDDVIIADGHTVTIDLPGQAAKTLIVNGSLTYHTTTVSSLTVSGDVTVSTTGSFTSPSTGNVVTHALNIGGSTATGVGGNLLVNGTFNMNVSTAGVIVTFYGSANNTVSSTGSTINFFSLTVNKGSSFSSILEVNSVITIVSPISAGINLFVASGTFKLSSPSVLIPYYGVQVLANGSGKIWINNSGAVIKRVGMTTGRPLIYGGLHVTAGTFEYGSGSEQFITQGSVIVDGPDAVINFFCTLTLGTGFNFNMTAGNINFYANTAATKIFTIELSNFSQSGIFSFTGGMINIVDPPTSSTAYAFDINNSGGTLTYTNTGTIRFGNGVSNLAGSVNGFQVNMSSVTYPLYNVILNNSLSSVSTTRLVKLVSDAQINGTLTINNGTANNLDINGKNLYTTSNIVNNGNINGDGIATSTLLFNGTSQQTISGSGSFTNGNIRNITLNSTSVSSPSVDFQKPVSFSNGVTLTNGTLGTTNSSAITFGRSASSTSFTLTRSGGNVLATPTFNFGGVTTVNYTYTAPVPAAATTTGLELPGSTTLSTLSIQNVSGVTLDKAVSCNTLSLNSGIFTTSTTNSITVLGTTTASVAGGSATAYVNGPLTRTLPNTATAGNYKFPVGKNSAYELFEFASLNTGGTGTGTVTVEVYNAGPYAATAGTGLSAINTNKYWSLSSSLGSVTVNPSSTIRLTDAGIVSFSKVAQSNNNTGNYNSIGGVIAGTTAASTNPFDQSALGAGTYFRVGTGGSFSAGTYAIGPQASYTGYAGTFPSMTAAIGAITNTPLVGHMIFEFQSDYVPSVETYPITLTPSIFNDVTKKVTFRPASGVSSLITFSSTGAILTNTGADYITFDGRNGGTGTNRFLKFASTSATLGAVTFGTNAIDNQFLFCQFKGATTAASTGVLTVGTGSNSPLTVDNCDFDGSGLANSCFFATTGVPNVTISNSNFFDYRNGSGVNLPAGSNTALIENNSFYQTLPYNGLAGTTYGINVIGITNGIIRNNNIGGSGPGINGIWTVTSSTPAAYNFTGIYATSLTTSKIYGNKIQNFDWKCSVATWTGINAGGTSGSIGTDGANYIGSNTGNDNIKITYYATGAGQVNGILVPGNNGTVAVENNIVGSITTLLSGITTTASSFAGINSTSLGVINNNIIGSATTPLSINLAAQSVSGTAQNVYGITYTTGSTGAFNVTNNTIANIINGTSLTTGLTRGILIPNLGTSVNIANNSIFSISTSSTAIGTGATSSLIGILTQSAAASGVTLSGNQIYDLSNTTASAAVAVDGICFSSSTSAVNKIEKNLIHSLNTVSGAAIQNGINVISGLNTVQNNVIRLGIDKNGNSIISTAQINGITKSSSSAGILNFFNNTVYIGGSGVTASAVNTRAFNLATHSNEDIRNNIFVNTRTNAVANPTNYALWLPASVPSNFISDYNIYHVSGTDGRLARMGVTDLTNIGALQALFPGNDLHSGFGDPLLTNPAVSIATMSLVPQNTTPAEGTGIAIGSVTDDFTGAARSGLTPNDIGAYAGNFTSPGSGQDIFYPVISYTPLLNTGLTTNRTTVSFANITDNFTGINTTAGTMPRLYFKKSTDANAFVGNTNADNGWKWVEANNSSSPFDFTFDYSIINGGSVVSGDVIQYFIVAQDLATTPNVSFNPSNGASGTSVAPTGMSAPTIPNSYGIVSTIASAVDVGTGYPYTTLTGSLASGGLFAAINAGVINSNVVATIKTNIVEPGTVSLNAFIEEGPNAGTLTFTIQSDGVSRILSGTMSPLTAPLILFNGASRVYINGGSKFLTFRNANATYNTTGPVMQFQNGSQNCTVTQCIFESNSYGPAAGQIVAGTTGINSLTISNNTFRDNRGTTPGAYRTAIYSNSVNNSLTITNNNISNFKSSFASDPAAYGINLPAVANGCNITGNSFYMETGSTVCPIICIYISGGNSHMISGNFIGGSAPGATGTWNHTLYWSNPTLLVYLNGVTAPASTIQGNTISGFNIGGTGTFAAIQTNASVANVIGNTIGSATVANAIQYSSTSSLYGIYNTVPTGVCNFDGNTIANITFTIASGTTGIRAMMMYGGNVRKNKIFNIGSTNAAASPTIYGIWNDGGATTNEFSNNMIALNGGNSGNPALFGFYDVSTTAGNYYFYYNSVNIYGTATGAAATYAFYRGNSPVYTLNNNILANRRTGTGTHYAIFSNSAATLSSDYNDLYTAGAAFGSFAGSAKPNLAAWQTLPQDLHSVNTDPAFTSNTDLHIVADPNLQAIGIPVSVLTDIDGLTRCSTPDPGINQFSDCTKTLNLTVFLEGLYIGGGMMSPAIEITGGIPAPKWGATIADQIIVELHDATTYSTLVHSVSNVELNTNGTALVTIPANFSGNYYLTIRHRNSILTVSANPVSFASGTISYNFSDAITKAYGSNQRSMGGGIYAFWVSDVTSVTTGYPIDPIADGVVDLEDLYYLYSSYLAGDFGYKPGDVNGNGVVDIDDVYMCYSNYLLGIYMITPIP